MAAGDASQPTSVGVDLELAIQCVELTKLSYANPVDGAALALGRFGYQSYQHVSRRDDRDYLIAVADDSRIFVAVRGTDQRKDWLTNLKFWRRDTPIGRVHKGYFDVCQDFLPEVKSLVDNQPGKPIVFTGHSMGGAVAVLLATFLMDAGYPIDSLYTFGQPQVGAADFSAHFESNCAAPYFRFVHGADAFATWAFGSHGLLGTPCYFDLRGRLSFGHQLGHIPSLGIRFHRLDQYRYFLKLNRLRLRAMADTEEVTVIQSRP